MDIKTFNLVASKLPAEMALLLRGPTGVGKSFLGKAIADELGLPFIDVRLSVMSEGGVAGYPDLEGMKKNGIMTMCMPSWFMRACKEPVVLMLDEMNRALPGVQQSAFQLVLDRELGNDEDGVPYKLHPDTRIIAAVNHGAEYDVNDMDPALLRRFWVTDIMPTTEDWILWAGENDKELPKTVQNALQIIFDVEAFQEKVAGAVPSDKFPSSPRTVKTAKGDVEVPPELLPRFGQKGAPTIQQLTREQLMEIVNWVRNNS